MSVAECGSGSGLWAHRRRGEPPCGLCLEFRRWQDREIRRRRASSPEAVAARRERFGGTVAGLIVDVLESYCGEWLSTGEVVDACVVARPGVNRRSVERVLHRLEGVEHRPPDEWSRESRWRVEWRSYWT